MNEASNVTVLQQPAVRFRVIGWKALRREKLRGFAAVLLDGYLEIHGIGVFAGENGFWASLPSSRYEARDGKLRYDPIVAFTEKGRGQAFSAALVMKLRREHPEDFL